ncbi:MAG TPA: hypothetical protein ENI19_00895 [Candidatus Nealsonbacteria bacterium]|uniref:Uncharacterized protein n=1 Tax=marine sediment metagenome TaxID=412755 RepID=A0A0F9XXI5_9ZZZZ|nr:hypothetical protein [Candidatus Nealsonbacteria bacterium]HEB46249.1 hypothetical protein [Candidatus Nealsonbacteria bacterium]
MAQFFIEKEEALRRYDQLINIRFPAMTAFLFAAFILKVSFNVSSPNLLFFLISFMLISTIIYDFLFRQIKEPKSSQIVNGYFGYLLFDVIILSIVIYLVGGITWLGFIFYGLYIYTGFLLFPRIYSLFFIFYCSFLYTALVIVQYLEILPLQSSFSLEERIPQNFPYAFSAWIAAIIFFWLFGYYGDTFYKFLQEKIKVLQKTKEMLKEERASLEIRVRARTEELSEERESLEEKVRERTRELEGGRKELTKRIVELERFRKVAVGRELKMRALKKEIEKLEKALKKSSSR